MRANNHNNLEEEMSTNAYTQMLSDVLSDNYTEIIVDKITREPITDDPLEHKGGYDVLRDKIYCTQNNSDCINCSLVNYGMDCRNNVVNNQ